MLLQKIKPRRSDLRAALIAAGVGVFASTGASAGTIVSIWDFALNNGFTAFTDEDAGNAPSNPVTGSNPNALLESVGVSTTPFTLTPCSPVSGTCAANPITGAPFASAPSKLSWGAPFSPNTLQSSIEVGSTNGLFDSGSPGYVPITTGGGFEATVKVTHNNHGLHDNTGELDTATLTDVLTLKPNTPSADPFFVPVLTFAIDFEETSNTATPCADTTSPTNCNDIFVIDVQGAGFDPITKTLTQQFLFDTGDGAELYEAIIKLDGLVNLADAVCTAAGASTNVDGGADDGLADNCIGITTVENMPNSFQTSLAINHIPQAASEPGTLAVLGLGLVGLGFMRRRRRV